MTRRELRGRGGDWQRRIVAEQAKIGAGVEDPDGAGVGDGVAVGVHLVEVGALEGATPLVGALRVAVGRALGICV